jgi:hypothetical protein
MKQDVDARHKAGHDERVSQGELMERFAHTNFNFKTAKMVLRLSLRAKRSNP